MWKLSTNIAHEDSCNVILAQEFTETFQLSKFEVNTVTSLSSDKGLKNVLINSISSPSYVVVALENKIYVFKEEGFELFWEFSFDDKCCSVILSDDLCLLLVVKYPGTLHLFYIPSQKSVWSYVFEEDGIKSTIQNAFFLNSSGFLSFCVFMKEGDLFEFPKIETSAFCQALEAEKILELFNEFHPKKIDLSSVFPDCDIKSAFETFSDACPIGLDVETKLLNLSITDYFPIEEMIDGNLSCDWEWNPEEKNFFMHYDFSTHGTMEKIACTRDGRYIVCLNDKHLLLIFCSFTHAVIAEWGDGDIVTFIFSNTVDPENLSVSDCQIGLARKCKGGHIFEIRKFPSFEFVHKIQLSEFVWLFEGKPNQDSWYIIEGNQISMNSENSILSIKRVSESSPEARLMSLLNRRKFKEAAKYAQMKNLNTEIIYRTKIGCMLKDYSAFPDLSFTKDEQHHIWKELEHSLNQIKDVEFMKSCITSLTPEMDFMNKFLSCINNWLAANNDIDGAEDLICQLNMNGNKLLTYKVLPVSSSTSLSLSEFLKKDLLRYMISELISDRLSAALIIWQRHKEELLTTLTTDDICVILNAVSGNVPSCLLIPFLGEDFLPPVLSKIPEAIDCVADWIISRIYLLELNEKDSWPENGHKMAVMFLELIQSLQMKAERGAISFSMSISVACIHKKLIDLDSHTGSLFELSKHLKQLVKLRKGFNCKIPLTTFQESKVDVISAVLDRINVKHIGDVISEFVKPFVLENDLDLDLCLELYIKNTLKTSCYSWMSWDEAFWEERLTLVLECINVSSRWVNSALLLISRAAVPWSDRIKKLVEQGLSYNHSKKKEFEQQSKQVGLKEVLVKYNIRNFLHHTDLKLIDTLVNYIFKVNKPSALEDAKKVMLAFYDNLNSEVYFKYLQFFLSQNKFDEFVSLFTSVPLEIALDCSHFLLRSIQFRLEDSFLVNNDPERIKNILNIGIYLNEFLRTRKQPFDNVLHNSLQSMRKLQKEFNIIVPLSDIMSAEKAIEILEEFIRSSLNAESALSEKGLHSEKETSSVSFKIFKINRLGDILGLERVTVMGILITHCLQRKMYTVVIQLCSELIGSYRTTESAETLMQVVNHFYQNFQNLKNMSFETIADTLCYLSNLAVTFCHEASIDKYMQLARLSIFFAAISKITGQKLHLSSNSYASDAYHKWRFNPIYDDGGFQLDVEVVIDFAVNLCSLPPLKHDERTQFPMQSAFSTVFKPLIVHMQQKGQGLTVLRTIFLFYHMNMEFPEDQLGVSSDLHLISSNLVLKLIQRIIDQRRLDLELSIGLMTIYPGDSLLLLKTMEKWCAKDLRCVMALGEIGTEFCYLFGYASKSFDYKQMYRRAVLLLKQNAKSSHTDIILNSSESDYSWDVIKEIILSPKTTLSTILECCNAFNLAKNHVLIAFLNSLFMEAEKHCISAFEIPVNDLQLILSKAKCVIYELEISPEEIVKHLESQLKKIGSYSHEVLLFIYEQILSVSAEYLTVVHGNYERGIALLNFLLVYERVSPPTEIEVEHWLSLHSLDSKLPAISCKRIPFWAIIENTSFKIINPELRADTLSVWLEIAPLLNVPKDELVMIAVKNSVMSYLMKLPAKHFILNEDSNFICNINKIIQNISDPQLTVAIASWVANKMPPGANKVCSSMIATKYAEEWCKMCPDERKAGDVYKTLSSRYQCAAVERILYQNNLADERSLLYAHRPVQLIEYFTDEHCSNPQSSITVCKIAADISKVVNLNLADTFFKYFHKWLNTDDNASDNLDESLVFNEMPQDELHGDSSEGKNTLKAINLLLGLSSIDAGICKSLEMKSRSMTVIQRSRFLFCLVTVYGFETVADAFGLSASDLESSLPLFLCAAELERLHQLYSRDIISNCNKVELLQRILSNQHKNSKILLCCVRMSLEYNVWCSQIWDVLLQRLVMMSMCEPLQDILQTTQAQLMHMWNYKSYISAWNCIICNTFKTESTDESKVIERIYKTVLRCPCAVSLDVESLWNDLKYYIKSLNGKSLRDMEPVSDICSFIQVLKSLQENW